MIIAIATAASAAAIEIINNPELRNKLSSEGRDRASQFTWNKTVDLTLSAYEDYAKFM